MAKAKAGAGAAYGGSQLTLLAASKSQSVERMEALYRLGHRDFAENYAQEMIEKASLLASRGCTEIRWHFIGHLQTNKVKMLTPVVSSIHTVDSEKLAREIAKRWAGSGRKGPLSVFIEVNIDSEGTKTGLPQEDVKVLADRIHEIPELRLEGLMAMPAPGTSVEARRAFARLRGISQGLGSLTQGALSMGMSGDFEDAILEGATHVRVGTALFGAR